MFEIQTCLISNLLFGWLVWCPKSKQKCPNFRHYIIAEIRTRILNFSHILTQNWKLNFLETEQFEFLNSILVQISDIYCYGDLQKKFDYRNLTCLGTQWRWDSPSLGIYFFSHQNCELEFQSMSDPPWWWCQQLHWRTEVPWFHVDSSCGMTEHWHWIILPDIGDIKTSYCRYLKYKEWCRFNSNNLIKRIVTKMLPNRGLGNTKHGLVTW